MSNNISSPEYWNKVYCAGEQINRWPFSDLVALVAKFKPEPDLVLELGCGVGNNSRMFNSMQYVGVDSSPQAIAMAEKFYGGLFALTDIHEILADRIPRAWSLIFDRSALHCLGAAGMVKAIDLAERALKPDGCYIGVDWFDTPDVAFSEDLIRQLFAGHAWRLEWLERKTTQNFVTGAEKITWNVVARKR